MQLLKSESQSTKSFPAFATFNLFHTTGFYVNWHITHAQAHTHTHTHTHTYTHIYIYIYIYIYLYIISHTVEGYVKQPKYL